MRHLDLDLLARLPEFIDLVQELKTEVADLRAKLASHSASTNDEISIDEVVILSGRKRDALYKLIRRKRLPSTRHGRSLFVRRADVEALVAKGGAQ